MQLSVAQPALRSAVVQRSPWRAIVVALPYTVGAIGEGAHNQQRHIIAILVVILLDDSEGRAHYDPTVKC